MLEPATMMAIGGIGSNLLGGLGSLGSGSSLKKAMKYLLTAQREAQAYTKEMYGNARNDLDPYVSGGLGALPYYLNLASGGKLGESFDITDTPAYDYRLGKTEDAINRRYAAMGMANSRPNVNSIADAVMGLSADEFDRAYGRLGDLVGMGVNNSQYLGNLGMGAAGQNASTAMSGASQFGNLSGAMGNTWQSLGQNLGSGFSNAFDYAAMAPAINNLMRTMGGGSGTGSSANWGSWGANPANFNLGNYQFG